MSTAGPCARSALASLSIPEAGRGGLRVSLRRRSPSTRSRAGSTPAQLRLTAAAVATCADLLTLIRKRRQRWYRAALYFGPPGAHPGKPRSVTALRGWSWRRHGHHPAMSISLPSEMADGVRQRVASGTYATSEVMNPQRAALRGLAGHKPK